MKKFLVCLLMSIVSVLFISSASAETLTKARLVLDTGPYGLHSWLFQGIKDGTFKKYGLDVEYMGVGPGAVKVTMALNANAADIGIGDSAGVIIANSKIPAPKSKIIYVLDTRGQDGVVVLESSGITSVDELDGKTIGSLPTSTFRFQFPLLTKATPEYVNMPFPLRAPSLIAKKVDAVEGYLTSIPFSLQKAGIPYRQFIVDKEGKGISRSIIVSSDWANKNPEAVKNLRLAVDELVKKHIQDPVKSVGYLDNVLPGNQSLEVSRAQFNIKTLILTDFAIQNGLNNEKALRPKITKYLNFLVENLKVPHVHQYDDYFDLK